MSRVPALAIAIALYLLRRLRPATVAVVTYRTWRRLPPEQRQALLLAARRNGPRLASSLARRARSRA
jgi:TRAP-type C4-dicarboxylate transport system substrate-binding protein